MRTSRGKAGTGWAKRRPAAFDDFTTAGKQNWQKDFGGGRWSTRNHYGCSRSHAIVLVMRYVIVICAVTFFLIWDGLYNQGSYLDTTVREITRIVRYITSLV
jgi:hypothetical protein